MTTASDSTKRSGLDWVTLIYIGAYHALLLIGLPVYFLRGTPGWDVIAWMMLFVTAAGMSITVGYHRLYSHRTYRANPIVEWVLLFFGTLATQGSVLRWANDHRLHHGHVDTEADPYDTHKGFWHSHILWMFKAAEQLQDRLIGDLRKNRLLVFQDRHYVGLVVLTNVVVTGFVGLVTGDWFGAVVFGYLLRTFLVHHSTWFINSLAHMWGAKPYSSEHSAVNNFILAFLTYGEGYHNYHHTFAGDYRNGIRWWQFDPSKLTIWVLSKLGLASDLKRTDPLMIKKKLVQADRMLLISHLEAVRHIDVTGFKTAVEKLAGKLSGSMASAKSIMDRYRALDRRAHRTEMKELRRRFREVRSEIGRDLRTWRQLCRLVLKLQPA
jgi:stearoyl-CoA desaturase (delta-9 desaturase)